MNELLQYLASGLVIGCIYGLIAVGYTAVYNVTGIVNFAQGDASMLGALTGIALQRSGLPLPLAVVAAIAVVALVFVLMERIAVRPVGADVMRGIIVTIGVGVAFQGTAALLWGTDAQPLPAFSGERPVMLGPVTVQPQAFWILGATLAVMGGLYLFFTRTYLGKAYRACAMDAQAARLMGIRTPSMRAIGFVLSGGIGALAGLIIAPMALMQYDSGVFLGIKGFVACIIGGFGHPVGAALGGLVLGLLESFATGYVSSGFKNAIAFIVLLGFLFVRPGGLLGEFDTVKR